MYDFWLRNYTLQCNKPINTAFGNARGSGGCLWAGAGQRVTVREFCHLHNRTVKKANPMRRGWRKERTKFSKRGTSAMGWLGWG